MHSRSPHREKNLKMKVRTPLFGATMFAVLLALRAQGAILQQQPPTADQPQTPASVPTGTQTTTLPPQSQQSQGSAPLRVMVGKSLLINTTERVKRISVTHPTLASATVTTPTQTLGRCRERGRCRRL